MTVAGVGLSPPPCGFPEVVETGITVHAAPGWSRDTFLDDAFGVKVFRLKHIFCSFDFLVFELNFSSALRASASAHL